MFSGCCPWEWKLHGFSGKPPRGPAASDNRCHEAKDEDEKDEQKIKMDERFEVTTAAGGHEANAALAVAISGGDHRVA